MFENLSLNKKISFFKLLLSIFTFILFSILGLSILIFSIRNDILITSQITNVIIPYSILTFIGIGSILFVLHIIESSLNFKKYFKTNNDWESKKYMVAHYFESIIWGTFIIVIGIILFTHYRLTYVHYDDRFILLFISILGVFFAYIGIILGSTFKLSDKISFKKIKYICVSFIFVFIIILIFIFIPLIQGLLYTPITDKPDDFEMIMSADKFLDATPHATKPEDSIYRPDAKNSLEYMNNYPYVSVDDKFYRSYADIYDENFIISVNQTNEYMDYNNPQTNVDRETHSMYTLIKHSYGDKFESINLMYQPNQEKEGSILREYSYSTEYYQYQSTQNPDITPDYFVNAIDIDNRHTIEGSKFDINKYNESSIPITGFENMVNSLVSDIMIFTGEKEYHGVDVIVYEPLWNQIYNYIPTRDSIEVYVDKNTGAILKSNNNMLSVYDEEYTVEPYDDEIVKPEFASDFDGDVTHDNVGSKPFYDVNRDLNKINITLYGLSTTLHNDVEFKYGDQSKLITHEELENNTPFEFSFDKKEANKNITVYFDGQYEYKIYT